MHSSRSNINFWLRATNYWIVLCDVANVERSRWMFICSSKFGPPGCGPGRLPIRMMGGGGGGGVLVT